MSKLSLFAIGAALALSAQARAQGPTPQDRGLFQSQRIMEARYDPGNSYHPSNAVTCLVRKPDRIRECHTRDEWREIAAQKDRERAARK